MNNKGFFLSSLNIKARELKAHVFVIDVPGSVLTWDLDMVQYIELLGDNYCKVFSEAVNLYTTSGKKKSPEQHELRMEGEGFGCFIHINIQSNRSISRCSRSSYFILMP